MASQKISLIAVVLVCFLTSGCPARDAITNAEKVNSASTGKAALVEREVVFRGVGDVELRGTLLLPPVAEMAAAHSSLPGLVLVAGSGPTDRDGNQGEELKTDTLKQIAESLARQGIATLRYDKRGVGDSRATFDPAQATDSEKLAAFGAWENFVGDVEAALTALQKQPEVDAKRTGLAGHSEGGVLILQAASQLKTSKNTALPKLLILISTPGRSMDVILREQISNLLKRQQATAEQTKIFMEKNDAIMSAIRETSVVPADVPPGLAALYPSYLGKFLQSVFSLDPAQFATKFHGPVFVLQGEKDIQVSAARDATVLDAALKKRDGDNHSLFIVPDASHNLKIVKDESEPGLAGDVAAVALERLGKWLREQFAL